MEYELCVHQSKHKSDEFIINKLIEEGWEVYGENIRYGCTYYSKGRKLKHFFA